GQNRIFVVKGANDELKPADVDAAAEMLQTVDCIVLQFEIPLETVYYTIAFARKHGIRCILNPAPGQPIDITAVKDLDYFVPNESEAETITGMPVRNLDDAKKCAAKRLGDGIGRVIITLGANGSLLASRDGMEHLPAFTVKSLDSTGAGDAFIGSFAVFLGEGLTEREAVRRANLYAGLSTTGVRTQKSFYDRARFDTEWMARNPTTYGRVPSTRRRSEAPQIGLYARPGELRPPGRGRPGLRQYVSIVVNDFPYARGRALSKRNVLEPRYVFSISRTFSIPSVSVNFTSITSFMVVAT